MKWNLKMECTKAFLDSIYPKKSGIKFSKNIRKYLAKYKGSELPSVYRVSTELNEMIGNSSFIVGDYNSESKWLHGKRLHKVMDNYRTQGYAYTPNSFKFVDNIEDFWDTYQKIGICAIDVFHNKIENNNRFVIDGDVKKCVFCNNYEFHKEIRTYEVWVRK